MEFRDELIRSLTIQEKSEKRLSKAVSDVKRTKLKWKFFRRSKSANTETEMRPKPRTTMAMLLSKPDPPNGFLCPITGSVMSDPVIVHSGHSFERACVEACKAANFTPSSVDFSTVIPNLALRSTIAEWCRIYDVDAPSEVDSVVVEKLVRSCMALHGYSSRKNECGVEKKELDRGTAMSYCPSYSDYSSVVEVEDSSSSSSSSSSSESFLGLEDIENPSFASEEEEEIYRQMISEDVFDVEHGATTLREITREREESRARLCSYVILSALRSLIQSRFTGIQVNSVAALVNLSLEKSNKRKIVRSGLLPPLIEVLKSGSLEAQEQAAGAIFSLALDDDNKDAIGVLGALQPLLHLLRAESFNTRRDSILALYQLSLTRENRAKLVKLGAVAILIGMVQAWRMTGRAMVVLASLAMSACGRIAMMDACAVECLVDVLYGEAGSRLVKENCVMILYALSHGGLRFKAVAREAGVVDALLKFVEEPWSDTSKEKATMVVEAVEAVSAVGHIVEDWNWEETPKRGFDSQNGFLLSSEMGTSMAKRRFETGR